MNETQDPTRDQSAGPRVSGEQMRDVSRLRRSRSDRYLAGVAGGLGRHFDIDPTVIRVLLAVLTFFGGAGLVVYVAVWVLVPEDGEDHAPIDLKPDLQRALLVTAMVVAALIVFGTPFANHSWGWGFPLPLLVIGLVGLWVYTLVRRDRPAAPPAPWTQPASEHTEQTTQLPPATPAAEEGTPMSTTETQQLPIQQPPAWMPPPPAAYVPPPRPRRNGLVLFWPTLALIAIAEGTLAIIDTGSSVQPSAYVALAVAVTAVMLLVGAFVGRPGGLIALGLVTSLGLGITSAVEAATDWNTGGETLTAAPLTAAGVQDTYTVPNGHLTLDLVGVRDVTALDGRHIAMHLNAGEIDVHLPRGLNAVVHAQMHVVGGIDIDGSQGGGFDQEVTRTITGPPATNAPTITLDIDARVGQITVDQS